MIETPTRNQSDYMPRKRGRQRRMTEPWSVDDGLRCSGTARRPLVAGRRPEGRASPTPTFSTSFPLWDKGCQ